VLFSDAERRLPVNRLKLKLLLLKHEGKRAVAYVDTAGKITIGVGRNLIDEGVSDDEITFMLDNDINRVFRELVTNVPSFGSLDDTRQHVLMDMDFNLGLSRFRLFVKMLAALERRDFETAANEMLDSKWSKQVGQRAQDLAVMMRNG
jgi:lysozyme